MMTIVINEVMIITKKDEKDAHPQWSAAREKGKHRNVET